MTINCTYDLRNNAERKMFGYASKKSNFWQMPLRTLMLLPLSPPNATDRRINRSGVMPRSQNFNLLAGCRFRASKRSTITISTHAPNRRLPEVTASSLRAGNIVMRDSDLFAFSRGTGPVSIAPLLRDELLPPSTTRLSHCDSPPLKTKSIKKWRGCQQRRVSLCSKQFCAEGGQRG